MTHEVGEEGGGETICAEVVGPGTGIGGGDVGEEGWEGGCWGWETGFEGAGLGGEGVDWGEWGDDVDSAVGERGDWTCNVQINQFACHTHY